MPYILNYYTTKYALTIPKKTLIDFPEVCNSSQYTHVVTSVTYGLEAIMDFHKKTRDEDFEGNIAGSLGYILNMIPGLATGSSHMSEEDRVIADSCTITVFGDFSPDEKPLPAARLHLAHDPWVLLAFHRCLGKHES